MFYVYHLFFCLFLNLPIHPSTFVFTYFFIDVFVYPFVIHLFICPSFLFDQWISYWFLWVPQVDQLIDGLQPDQWIPCWVSRCVQIVCSEKLTATGRRSVCFMRGVAGALEHAMARRGGQDYPSNTVLRCDVAPDLRKYHSPSWQYGGHQWQLGNPVLVNFELRVLKGARNLLPTCLEPCSLSTPLGAYHANLPCWGSISWNTQLLTRLTMKVVFLMFFLCKRQLPL